MFLMFRFLNLKYSTFVRIFESLNETKKKEKKRKEKKRSFIDCISFGDVLFQIQVIYIIRIRKFILKNVTYFL